MDKKTYIPEGEIAPSSQIGSTLEALAATIAARKEADSTSYTHRLLTESIDLSLSKVTEEAAEVVEAVGEGDVDHVRYEAGDLIYHLLVVMERVGIPIEELAAELNNRMTEEERPEGGLRLHDAYVKRGK